MNDFQKLRAEVQRGMEGKNEGVPMGFHRLNKFVSINRKLYTVIFGPTGCITGDTIIHLRRGKRNSHRKYTIEEAYNKQEGIKSLGRPWSDLEKIPQTESYMPDLGGTKMHNIVKIVQSGEKEVYEIVTESFKRIKATKDHKFMIEETIMGEEAYLPLSQLKVGMKVVCKAPRQSRAKGRKVTHRDEYCGLYPYYKGARYRTINGTKYQRVYHYRAIYDANLNGITIEEFLEQTKRYDNNLKFSDPKMVIHHIDENPLNNDFTNLALLTKKEHDSLHNKRINLAHGFVQLEEIKSITLIGKKMTYDIICKAPYHNFIANGFVVHNSGKSALLHNAFILNPFEYIMSKHNTQKTKLKVILFSQERSKSYTLAKWISRRIFLDHGVLIPLKKLMGWWEKKIDHTEFAYFDMYEDYIESLLKVVDIIEGPQNPTGVYKYVKKYAEDHGTIEVVDEYHKIYHANDPSEIVVPIIDHFGLTKSEKGMSKKEAIDKTSEYFQHFRDFYGYSPVGVSQLTRNLNNPLFSKMDSFEPTLDDVKESGRPGEDADQVLSIFEPLRFRTKNLSYDAEKFVDEETGERHFRSVSVLKNSYGESDINIGMAMQGATGFFKELPKPSQMPIFSYESVTDNSYFLS